ncbi:MAG: hypothetical protein ABSH20_04340 [Tepidisphaeraceae bacterium]|jgi:hypothetical protein
MFKTAVEAGSAFGDAAVLGDDLGEGLAHAFQDICRVDAVFANAAEVFLLVLDDFPQGLFFPRRVVAEKLADKFGTFAFARENLLCIFNYGGEAERFSIHKAAGDENSCTVNVVMSYIIQGGYRNNAHEVVLPDGKVAIVQKPVVNQWDKNAPHTIEIKPGAPYELVNWAEGANLKSLKERGLDTTKPGKYAIICIYQQSANPLFWTGSVRSNTVVVEVK